MVGLYLFKRDNNDKLYYVKKWNVLSKPTDNANNKTRSFYNI